MGFWFGGKDKNDPEAFWRWFEDSAAGLATAYDDFAAGKTGPMPLIAPVEKRLNRYHKGLVHEIGQRPDGLYDLVISADGIRDQIKPVSDLVKVAPKIDQWTVTAFRAPKPIGDPLLELDGEMYRLEDVFYRLTPGEDGLSNIVLGFHAKDAGAAADDFIGPGFLILDRVIGEFNVMTRIGEVSTEIVSDDGGGMSPIASLADEFGVSEC